MANYGIVGLYARGATVVISSTLSALQQYHYSWKALCPTLQEFICKSASNGSSQSLHGLKSSNDSGWLINCRSFLTWSYGINCAVLAIAIFHAGVFPLYKSTSTVCYKHKLQVLAACMLTQHDIMPKIYLPPVCESLVHVPPCLYDVHSTL